MAHRHPFRSPPPPVMGLAVLGILVVAAYPFALEWALLRYGVQGVSVAMFATGAAGLAWRWSHITAPALRPTQLAILALLALAATSKSRTPLLFVPAVIQLGLAGYFIASLRPGDSVVERMAHFMQPYLPDWIRPYCRIVTALWALFFLANAVAIAWLATEADPSRWKAWTGAGLYITALVLQGIEALFRKGWFRAFDEGPIDRLFARLFPPERTRRGRRSMEYIRRMRIELGMEEP
ncbi:MAG: hypothetical protein GY937_20925 [bacterium]|nr:hypothetical protein [bacterium]